MQILLIAPRAGRDLFDVSVVGGLHRDIEDSATPSGSTVNEHQC